MDHDQRFKLLLQAFLKEFLELFFPDIARRIDFTKPIEWLNQEHFLDPPRGRKRVLDLVAKLTTLEPPHADMKETLALIHIEIEGEDSVADLRGDMYHYYEVLRRNHRCAVLPLALYLRVGLQGRGIDVYEEYFWEYRTVRFEYQYAGLPALDAAAHVAGSNLLGVALAPLMRMADEVRTELLARAYQRIGSCHEDPFRKMLLSDCLLAYGELTPEQSRDLEQKMNTESFKEGWVLRNTDLYRTQRDSYRTILKTMLETRFGPLTPQAQNRLESWENERLLELSKEFVAGKSLTEMGLED